MKTISIKKAETKREMDDFVRFTNWLYADCPYYVPDLEMDIRNTFDPRKNAGLEFSEIQPFIAYNDEGKPVGRIAGIINHRANKKWQTKNVRFGFIDFIDDLEVSATLLKAVEQWGKEHGMDSIQGPMGIFDFDKEGMLIEDFDKLGSMITIYNYPYYPKHMEALGYEKEVDWVFFSPAGTLEPGQRTGKFRLGKDDLIVDESGNSHISVEDYAIAMVDELEQANHHQERFTIGY